MQKCLKREPDFEQFLKRAQTCLPPLFYAGARARTSRPSRLPSLSRSTSRS